MSPLYFRALLRGCIILLVFLLAACASTSNTVAPGFAVSNSHIEKESLRATLYRQYQKWRGTRCHYGGMSKTGVDCSGFVYLTYRDQLGIHLPRTTLHQSTSGSMIASDELRAGDLVFFLTDGQTRHVGIYLDNSQFVHASKSQGVIVSSLDNNYWRDTFWQARRIAL